MTPNPCWVPVKPTGTGKSERCCISIPGRGGAESAFWLQACVRSFLRPPLVACLLLADDWLKAPWFTNGCICLYLELSDCTLSYLLTRSHSSELLSSREGILRCGGDRSLRTHPAIGSRSVLGECQIDWISCEARAFWEWSVTVLFMLPCFNDSLIRWNWWLFGTCESWRSESVFASRSNLSSDSAAGKLSSTKWSKLSSVLSVNIGGDSILNVPKRALCKFESNSLFRKLFAQSHDFFLSKKIYIRFFRFRSVFCKHNFKKQLSFFPPLFCPVPG